MLLARLECRLAQKRTAGAPEGIALGAVAARAGRHLLGLVLVGRTGSSPTGPLHGLLLGPAARAVVAGLASAAVIGRGRTGGGIDGRRRGQHAGTLLGQQVVLVDHIVVTVAVNSAAQIDLHRRRRTAKIELDGGRLVRCRFLVGRLLLPRGEDATRAVPAFRLGSQSRQQERIVDGRQIDVAAAVAAENFHLDGTAGRQGGHQRGQGHGIVQVGQFRGADANGHAGKARGGGCGKCRGEVRLGLGRNGERSCAAVVIRRGGGPSQADHGGRGGGHSWMCCVVGWCSFRCSVRGQKKKGEIGKRKGNA